jgi:membrane protein
MFGKFINKLQKYLVVQAFIRLINKEGLEYAGYISYLNFFSVFPLFIILITSISFFDETKIVLKIINTIINSVPDYASDAVKSRIQEIINGPPTKIISLVFIGALWTTASSLEGLRTAFNKIYDLPQPQFFLFTRLLSILQFIITVILLIFTIALFTILPKYLTLILHFIGISFEAKLEPLRQILSFITIIIIVCSLYYPLINRKVTIKELIPGAIINVVLWILTAKVMAYLLWSGNSLLQFNIVYGSLGSIIVALIFFYIANLSLLYGASFNYVLHRRTSHDKTFVEKRRNKN